MKSKLTRKIRRLLFNSRAISPVISNTILAGVVIALGFSVLSWTYNRCLLFNLEYSNVVEANLERIMEKLVFEYLFYDTSRNELTVYLINCGKINNVSLVNVYLSNNSWFQSFSDIELMFLNGTLTESLDIFEEGYFELSVNLVGNSDYSIRIRFSGNRDDRQFQRERGS